MTKAARQRTSRNACHPALLCASAWTLVVSLYAIRLSRVLLFPPHLAIDFSALAAAPFCLAALASSLGSSRPPKRPRSGPVVWRRLLGAIAAWALLTTWEIYVGGGVPALWLIQHSAKTYTDFGLHSLQGLLDSLLLAASSVSTLLFLERPSWRFAVTPVWCCVWSLVIVSRELLIVNLIQTAILFLMRRRIRPTTLCWYLCLTFIIVILFGAVGDARSGALTFRRLAKPAPDLPEWLPSGALWAYVYLVTPLNNLLFAASVRAPAHTWSMFHTVAFLLPSVIRTHIYRTSADITGPLVASNFNVSTAYIGPYLDLGRRGIILISALFGAAAGWAWRGRGPLSLLTYAVLAQCTILSVFSDQFLYLPVIFQLFWFVIFLAGAQAPPPDRATPAAA